MTASIPKPSELVVPPDALTAKKVSNKVVERPIWEIVADIGSQIPDELWQKVPEDASINYKHYLYGTDKQPS